jgi:glycosyltransferase involved in cell wall biosynthesis
MQTVFFISPTKPEWYPIIDKHYTWYPIHRSLSFEEFSELWHEKSPYAIYTYGNINITQWNYMAKIFNVRKRWIALESLPKEINIITNVFSTILHHTHDSNYPLISVISSSFHSKHKILKPFNSLKSQTYTNWEWVIWDDSKDSLTYEDLLKMQKTELRMRVYKAPKHSGSIGEMKRLAAGVSYGSFIVELDHDDEIYPELFQWIIDASKKYPEADFFYTDYATIYEKSLKSKSYGDFHAYGYGSNLNIWSDKYKQWITRTITPTPNPITLQHLVGLPNHVRVWRTEFYDKIGKHNPRLSVSDDYELLLKSFIHGKWCYIRECGYFQYINEDGNFTFIRNSLIQHNVTHIYNHYKDRLPPKPDNYKYEPQWKYDGEKFPAVHLTYDPHPHDYSIILLEADKDKIESIIKLPISSHIYIIGKCPDIPNEWCKKVSWWDLKSDNIDDKIRYGKKILATGKHVLLYSEIDQIKLNLNLRG